LSVCKASTRVSRASYWSRYQSRSELNRERRSYLSRARPSSSCHRRTRCGRKQSQETCECGRDKGKTPNSTRNTHLENPPHGTPADPQRLVQLIVEQGAVASKLLPQRLFGLGLVEVGRRCAGVTPLPLWARDNGVRGGQGSARRRGLGAV
jgi:hypothetical protein